MDYRVTHQLRGNKVGCKAASNTKGQQKYDTNRKLRIWGNRSTVNTGQQGKQARKAARDIGHQNALLCFSKAALTKPYQLLLHNRNAAQQGTKEHTAEQF